VAFVGGEKSLPPMNSVTLRADSVVATRTSNCAASRRVREESTQVLLARPNDAFLEGQQSSSPGCSDPTPPYTQGRCCSDLRRLKLKGLIVKIEQTNTYVLTPDGQRFAVFYTKVHNRLLRPLLAADHPPAPLPVRQALRTSTGLSPTTCPTRA
jgi:hypothetical protein